MSTNIRVIDYYDLPATRLENTLDLVPLNALYTIWDNPKAVELVALPKTTIPGYQNIEEHIKIMNNQIKFTVY